VRAVLKRCSQALNLVTHPGSAVFNCGNVMNMRRRPLGKDSDSFTQLEGIERLGEQFLIVLGFAINGYVARIQ
jgi:hypothetical protein